ncbi:MAG: hypothetical protein ABI200_03125 [Gaiellales bacterium]
MPATFRNSLSLRRYRVAQAITIAGAIAIGSLVVDRLVELFREDFYIFYGLTGEQYDQLRHEADSVLPLTLGTIVLAAIAFVSVFAFVWNERRRIAQKISIEDGRRVDRTTLVVERLDVGTMFDQFVTRTSSFAGLLLSIWLLQTSLERHLAGFGLGIDYVDWRSLLPFASVFGLCVLAGMLVAAVSLVGLRAIFVLEHVFVQMLRRRRIRNTSVHKPRHFDLHVTRTMRELIGYEVLSRPPPLAC